MKFEFELTGLTPILFHADDLVAAEEVIGWRMNPENANASVKGDDRSPPWTWQSYLYSDGQHLSIPQDNLMAALRWAGAKVILKGQTTYKALTQSGLIVDTEHIDFFGPEGHVKLSDIRKIKGQSFADQCRSVKDLGFSLYVKRASIGASKNVRVRARFDEWKASGVISIMNTDISATALKQIFEIAGDRAGLLDWRPSSKKSPGPYGRFAVKLKPIK